MPEALAILPPPICEQMDRHEVLSRHRDRRTTLTVFQSRNRRPTWTSRRAVSIRSLYNRTYVCFSEDREGSLESYDRPAVCLRRCTVRRGGASGRLQSSGRTVAGFPLTRSLSSGKRALSSRAKMEPVTAYWWEAARGFFIVRVISGSSMLKVGRGSNEWTSMAIAVKGCRISHGNDKFVLVVRRCESCGHEEGRFLEIRRPQRGQRSSFSYRCPECGHITKCLIIGG